MKRSGTIVTWFQHRNYGFIRPTDVDEEIFVHINDFPTNGPILTGTRVVFEMGQFGGKSKAVNVEVSR